MTAPRTGAGSADEQDLVRQYLPLVHHVVVSVRGRLPNHVGADELTSAAMVGLLHAIRGFDEARGVPFASYATTRIRGAVLDELRGSDWASRSLRAKARSLQAAGDQAGSTLEQAAATVGLSVEEARQVQADVQRASVLSIDALESDDPGGASLPTIGANPEGVLLDRERTGYLRDAVDLLPARLRHVVVGIFFEERTPAELAVELAVTESRISHMRAEAMSLLREAMRTVTPADGGQVVEDTPAGVAARRRAAYCDAVRTASDPRSRLDRAAPAAQPISA